ncbi:MAG TPA: hypothetical protein VMZ03_14505 [Chitinophagaceae bacterium]|nr:hypothetical protein [Chitinophagaceae bacterium]
MRTILRYVIAFTCLLFFTFPAHTATTPSSPVKMHVQAVLTKLASMKVKELQQLTGRKLTLKEKLGFSILKHQVKKGNGGRMAELFVKRILTKNDPVTKKHGKKAEETSKGQTALVFGIIGLVLLIAGLFIPYVIIGSLVASILAIVLGSVAKKENPSDTKASTAKLLGWITLGLIALLIIAVAVALSAWGWG